MEASVATPLDGSSAELKRRLARVEARSKMKALALVAPLLLFIVITFIWPIGLMLLRSFDNSIVPEMLPRTVAAIEQWNPEEDDLPAEEVYRAAAEDIQVGAKAKTINKLGQRLNYEFSGTSSLFRKTARRLRNADLGAAESARELLVGIDKKWGQPDVWKLIRLYRGKWTTGYYANALDLRYSLDGELEPRPDDRRIYVSLFWRTLAISAFITLMTFLLGYPVAYLLATLPTRVSNLLMILVLLPFWTSLLVRTTSWIVLLQNQGVINDLLVTLGLIDDEGRLLMIHNVTGTVIAMTHILLPFMILPLYSVMRTIPPSYVRAARSLGADPFTAFWKIYFPNSVPGIGAGILLVFILALGYYITPALVGGVDGVFISNQIAYHISGSLNWGLGAALGTLLLIAVLVFFYIYDKLIGFDNLKLG